MKDSEKKVKLNKFLRSCVDNYAMRVSQSKGKGRKSTALIFTEINANWVATCNRYKLPEYRPMFAEQVMDLNDLTLKVDNKRRRQRIFSFIIFWGFIIGLCYFLYWLGTFIPELWQHIKYAI